MRREAQRPGAEKAARQQELHKKLRVSLCSILCVFVQKCKAVLSVILSPTSVVAHQLL